MENDVMIFLTREEVEFIKDETVTAAIAPVIAPVAEWDRERIISLAAKLIEVCKKEEVKLNAISENEG